MLCDNNSGGYTSYLTQQQLVPILLNLNVLNSFALVHYKQTSMITFFIAHSVAPLNMLSRM